MLFTRHVLDIFTAPNGRLRERNVFSLFVSPGGRETCGFWSQAPSLVCGIQSFLAGVGTSVLSLVLPRGVPPFLTRGYSNLEQAVPPGQDRVIPLTPSTSENQDGSVARVVCFLHSSRGTFKFKSAFTCTICSMNLKVFWTRNIGQLKEAYIRRFDTIALGHLSILVSDINRAWKHKMMRYYNLHNLLTFPLLS